MNWEKLRFSNLNKKNDLDWFYSTFSKKKLISPDLAWFTLKYLKKFSRFVWTILKPINKSLSEALYLLNRAKLYKLNEVT